MSACDRIWPLGLTGLLGACATVTSDPSHTAVALLGPIESRSVMESRPRDVSEVITPGQGGALGAAVASVLVHLEDKTLYVYEVRAKGSSRRVTVFSKLDLPVGRCVELNSSPQQVSLDTYYPRQGTLRSIDPALCKDVAQ